MDLKTLAKSILEFANKDGYNCLLTVFDIKTGYNVKTGKYPDSRMPLLTEIESTVLFIEIGRRQQSQHGYNYQLDWR